MKKFGFLLLFLFMLKISGYADSFTINNQTKYPKSHSKMALQWAHSAQEVDEGNMALMQGKSIDQKNLQYLNQSGTVNVNFPQKAQYFRVLVWTKGEKNPDFHTNWVDIESGKTYVLKQDQLVPTVLIHGTGC